MLVVEGLALIYADGTEALRGIDLQLGRGIFGLLGPNGAGKSSLMRLLATLQRPSRGNMRFDDIDLLAKPERLRQQLGYLPQDFGVYPNASALDLLDHLAVLKGITARADRRTEIERLLTLANLWEVRSRAVATFSGGMRQRFGVAQALIGRPRLIIVDEPTAGLDPEERNRLYDVLAEVAEDAVVILSTHIIEDVASLCDRLGVLSDGRLLFIGRPEELASPLVGRIWLSEEKPTTGLVLSSRLVGRRRLFRILSDSSPASGSKQVEPAIEDGYLAVLKGALPC
jgi:ABC-type multidrug transport system ATPase subunit